MKRVKVILLAAAGMALATSLAVVAGPAGAQPAPPVGPPRIDLGHGYGTIGQAVQPTKAAVVPKGGIVYSRANDLWITSPDGKVTRRLTFNGTTRSPWRDPSMSTNGTVVAFRTSTYSVGGEDNARSTIYRLNQAGKILSSFRPRQQNSGDPGVLRGGGIATLAVSPDGSSIAWEEQWACVQNGIGVCNYVEIAKPDGSDSDLIGRKADMTFSHDPSWAARANNTLLFSRSRNGISYYDVGTDLRRARPPEWFGYPDFNMRYDPAERAGLLAVVGAFDSDVGNVDAIEILRTNGARPAQPTPICYLLGPAGLFHDPSWGPNGYLAWTEREERPDRPRGTGEGLWVGKIEAHDNNTCTLTLINGSSPSPVKADAVRAEWGSRFDSAARRGRSASVLEVSAGSGVTHSISVQRSGTTYTVKDAKSHAIAAGTACKRRTASTVRCTLSQARRIVLTGGDQADKLTVRGTRPVQISAGRGADVVTTGSGADKVTAGPGSDKVTTGAGKDTVEVRDGERDVVNCGAGRDRVTADGLDVLTSCETVDRG